MKTRYITTGTLGKASIHVFRHNWENYYVQKDGGWTLIRFRDYSTTIKANTITGMRPIKSKWMIDVLNRIIYIETGELP